MRNRGYLYESLGYYFRKSFVKANLSYEEKKALVHLVCAVNILAPEKGTHNRLLFTLVGFSLGATSSIYQTLNKQ